MNKLDDEYGAAIFNAFKAWLEKNDPENTLSPKEQIEAFDAYVRKARGLPPRNDDQHRQHNPPADAVPARHRPLSPR